MSRFRKFLRLRWSEKLLFCEALILHLFVGLLLMIVPFRRIPGIFKSQQFEPLTQDEGQSRYEVSGRQTVIIENIRVAVQRAGAVSPWRNRCLVSSLAGRMMLRKRGIFSEVILGVMKDAEGKLIAHAWLRACKLEVVEKREEFMELFVF